MSGNNNDKGGRCRVCNRALRSPAQAELGIGPVCARRAGMARKRYEALVGRGGDPLLFPEVDRTLIELAGLELAAQEVTKK